MAPFNAADAWSVERQNVTIQDLGSIGELLAAVATIATLIYLARQLRANTSAVRGDSRRASRGSSSASNLLIASDPAVAALFRAGLKDFHALTPDQHTQFSFLLAEQMAAWSNAYEEFDSGLIDIQFVENQNIAYLRFLLTPGGRAWWAAYRTDYPPTFRAHVDTHLKSAINERHAASGEAAAQQGIEPGVE